MGAAFAPDDRNAVWTTTVNAETKYLVLTSEAVFREAMQTARRVFAVEEGFREVEVEWERL